VAGRESSRADPACSHAGEEERPAFAGRAGCAGEKTAAGERLKGLSAQEGWKKSAVSGQQAQEQEQGGEGNEGHY